MPSHISIRPATTNDSAAVARLTRALGYSVTTPVIRQRLADVLASTADLILVAENSSGVVGWLQAHAAHVVESGFRVEIVGLIVADDVRRQGVGRALVAAAEQWAGKSSAEAIVVRSNAKRVESHAFYPALGYETTKTQVVYRKPMRRSKA